MTGQPDPHAPSAQPTPSRLSAPTPLPTARLGEGGPEVGVQGLGCMGMSFAYGPVDTDASRATLERALELGVTLYDTADAYGAGDNERFLSPFFAAHRDEVVIATKFALSIPPDDPTRRVIRNDAPYIRQAVEASLKRLDVDVIDLYYMHRRQVDVPIEETVGVMADLVREGKVKQLGLSEVTADELRAAHGVHPIAAVQSEWSLFSRDIEARVVPAARELGVTLVPYSPLGRGFLTGSFGNAEKDLTEGDFRRQQPRFTGENAAANAALLEPLRTVADAHGATLGQVALAWVQQRASVHGLPVVPIPGTRKPGRVEENVGAVGLVLGEEELALLEPVAGKVAGDRYADMTFTSAGRE
ncbi:MULTISPECIES: aldo/keto reductase [unclassified Streptomyces]|uniref:aldo/keto reductase n=1 Tax=unclassified Streptomyces TaxID=2593676 RepID=UPI00381853CE